MHQNQDRTDRGTGALAQPDGARPFPTTPDRDDPARTHRTTDCREGMPMTHELEDRTGAPVRVTLERGDTISAYAVDVGAARAGRVDFVDPPGTDERIFFHTEVDEQYAGRGLAGLLVREALADSIRLGLVVVPVCPLFARHLERHGDDFRADGGRYRRPAPADLALVRRAVRGAV